MIGRDNTKGIVIDSEINSILNQGFETFQRESRVEFMNVKRQKNI